MRQREVFGPYSPRLAFDHLIRDLTDWHARPFVAFGFVLTRQRPSKPLRDSVHGGQAQQRLGWTSRALYVDMALMFEDTRR